MKYHFLYFWVTILSRVIVYWLDDPSYPQLNEMMCRYNLMGRAVEIVVSPVLSSKFLDQINSFGIHPTNLAFLPIPRHLHAGTHHPV